jgi:hypothetical protein
VNPALRILFVAVSNAEADSVIRALETAGYAPTSMLLPSLAAVPGELAAASWDAVVPGERAPALDLAQATNTLTGKYAGTGQSKI